MTPRSTPKSEESAVAHAAHEVSHAAHEVTRATAEVAEQVAATIKPKLRGWLHLGMVPLCVAACIVLIVLAPSTPGRISSAIFGVCAVSLFATSATYHRGRWQPTVSTRLKRMDHANIFLIIAGSYTPLAVMLLAPDQARTLLILVWVGALGGVLFRVFWVGAPRWLYTPLYVVLGWVAVFYIVPFYRAGGLTVVVLIATGGLLYTLGAVVYGLKWPNPSPRWFGFHEVFHAFTLAAFTTHYIAVSMAVYGAIPGVT
ncbi:MAG: hemolysin III family protein [Ornithinimicrobium sp.]